MELEIFLCYLILFHYSTRPIESVCIEKVDGILWPQTGKYFQFYLFNEDHFWLFDFANNSSHETRKINDVWPEVVIPIDGVTTLSEKVKYKANGQEVVFEERVLLVKANEFWMYPARLEGKTRQPLLLHGKLQVVSNFQIHGIAGWVGFDDRTPILTTHFAKALFCAIGGLYTCPVNNVTNLKDGTMTLHIENISQNRTTCLTDVCECQREYTMESDHCTGVAVYRLEPFPTTTFSLAMVSKGSLRIYNMTTLSSGSQMKLLQEIPLHQVLHCAEYMSSFAVFGTTIVLFGMAVAFIGILYIQKHKEFQGLVLETRAETTVTTGRSSRTRRIPLRPKRVQGFRKG